MTEIVPHRRFQVRPTSSWTLFAAAGIMILTLCFGTASDSLVDLLICCSPNSHILDLENHEFWVRNSCQPTWTRWTENSMGLPFLKVTWLITSHVWSMVKTVQLYYFHCHCSGVMNFDEGWDSEPLLETVSNTPPVLSFIISSGHDSDAWSLASA